MNREDKVALLRATTNRHGEWFHHDIDLGDGLWTMGAPRNGPPERNARRVARAVLDLTRADARNLRVADLGAGEGIYGLELARRGASLFSVEGREAAAAKINAAARALELENVTSVCSDIRNVDLSAHGPFDVVICQGLIYHLDAKDTLNLVKRIHAAPTALAVFGTAISVRAEEAWEDSRRTYWGRTYPEPKNPWASMDNEESFWFTKPSLVNLLMDAGFTSVFDLLAPAVQELAEQRDYALLAALAGSSSDTDLDRGDALSEQPADSLHPSQQPSSRLPLLGRIRKRRLRRTFLGRSRKDPINGS